MTPAVPTIASRIRERAQREPDGVAMREKSLGIWQETTWAQYLELVERAAHGLLALALRQGDRLAVLCENRPEWLVAEGGAVAARVVTVGLDPAAPATELEARLRGSRARVLVAEDQEQVDKALAHKAALPDLEWIVYVEPRGVRDYADPFLVWWPDLLERGDAHRREHPRILGQLAAGVSDDDPVALAAAGDPPAPLSARRANLALVALADRCGIRPDPGPEDVVLCNLPMWRVEERLAGAWLNAHAGVQLHFGEPSAEPMQTLREVQPSLLLAVPGTWERLRAAVEERMASATWLRRRTYELAMRNASAIGRELTAAGGVQSLRTRLRYAGGYPLVYRTLRDRLGMRNCRSAVSVGPLPPEVADWYLGLGIPVRELSEPAGEVA